MPGTEKITSDMDFRSVLDGMPVLFWSMGTDRRFNWVNRAYLEFTGRELDECLGIDWLHSVHRADIDQVCKTFIDGFARRETYIIEYRLRRHDGVYRWVKDVAAPQFQNGEFKGYLGFCIDQNESHLSLEQLHQNEESLRRHFEEAAIGMVQLDVDGRILRANPRLCEMLGSTPEAAAGRDIHEWVVPENAARLRGNLGAVVSGRLARVEDELRFRHQDGRTVHTWLRMNPISNWLGHPVAVGAQIIDVTRRVELEAEIEKQRLLSAEAAKMVALGEMAAGMAHEINNPLTIIMGKAQEMQNLLATERFDKRRFLEDSERILNTVRRIATIVKGLRAFARDERRDSRELVNVVDIVRDTLSFCQARIREQGIEFSIPDPAPPALFHCYPGQISQILLNLLNNALYAVSQGGDSLPWIRLEVEVGDRELLFRVSDSGPGVPADIVGKVFQPFFTTKPPGQGAGMGLSIAMGLAESHGGKISLVSLKNPTVFEVRFPYRRKSEREAS